jgi:hypothetical protein
MVTDRITTQAAPISGKKVSGKVVLASIRSRLLLFIILMVLSGITAFPLRTELSFLHQHIAVFPETLGNWIKEIEQGLAATPDLVLYGTDWLAFAHLVIALYFIPVYRTPSQYQSNIRIGMLACKGVFGIAFICGAVRSIPFFHQLIDCSFGVFGYLLLWSIDCKINTLNQLKHQQ